jgi:hypothetical protein
MGNLLVNYQTEGFRVELKPELVAPCGMNCAVCSRFLALKNNLRSKSVNMAYCTGCRTRNRNCAFLKKRCPKLLTGEITFCFECKDFPCNRLKTIDARYQDRYKMSWIENLNFIKENGMTKFLEKQEKTWKCPNCGESICCHNGICFNCGLEKLKLKKEKYRWDNNQNPVNAK